MPLSRVWKTSLAVALVLSVGLIVGPRTGEVNSAALAAPAQPPACGWDNIGSSTSSLFHAGHAMDTDTNRGYVYGGFDDLYNVQNTVEQIDLTSDTLMANHGRIPVGTALAMVGSAGAYRAKGPRSDQSAAYFIGGVRNAVSGQADNEVQRYRTADRRWERLTIANARLFKDRFLAAAAYDPAHDVIWVVGGISRCIIPDTPAADDNCPARPLPTQYLSFDRQTGEPTWNTLPGGDRSIFGHSMVYDATRKRMLIYGGTTNITRGTNQLWALDLSDADPQKATFSQVRATVDGSGTAPTVYFHGAAMDESRDWMVVTGGVRQNYAQRTEVTESVTWALDLSTTPRPTWRRIAQGTSAASRVGGVMEYSPKHQTVVFALGRDTTDGNENTPEQMQRRTVGLVCEDAGTPRPTRTATVMPSPTGPTSTVRPTRTRMPTFTPRPSRTPFPTYTPSVTHTSTATATATDEPSTTAYMPYANKNF
jgi:hypothetical protein